MTLFNLGDVVLIGFPFTDLSGSKQRPALVISSKWYNENKIDIILAAITSQIPAKPDEDEYLLSHKEQNLAGLLKQSIVKVGKIITLDQRLIRKKLGHLQDETLFHIKNILLKIHI
ncbi:MAG: type II toxin-antitoxin system PemK/MazF family toxin [Elusimicrobia bacterium]|nr:type II toxin-antitoxin system PemK/MazF family toxin [Elusimicrobiota bacterium]